MGGDAGHKDIRRWIRGLRKGMRPGDLRLAAWSQDLRTRLMEAGYPEAQVTWSRSDGDRTLAVTVTAGTPSLVRQVDLVGDPAPYTRKELLDASGLRPGQTLWSQRTQVDAVRSLRALFRSHHRYEAQVDLLWDGQGAVRLTVAPGPRVNLAYEGDDPAFLTDMKELVPLPRADRYSPEVLDEGDRALVRFLRGKGYLDAQVGHRREVTAHADTPYEEVTVTYIIQKGRKTRLKDVQFEGNAAVSEADLKAAVPVRRSFWPPFSYPSASPDFMDALESRVKAVYLSRGYPDVSLRRQLESQDGQSALVMRVREGPRRMLQWLRLELPPLGMGDPWSVGECLPLVFSEGVVRTGRSASSRTYVSDRPALKGIEGVLTRSGEPGPGAPSVFTFTLDRPIPLLKADLTRVYGAIRQQRLPALGMVRPVARLSVEPGDPAHTGVRVEVPPQPMEQIQRLVVMGADKTRATAVLRETQLRPGEPLDTDQLARAQARLGVLGVFQRVDLQSLAQEEPQEESQELSREQSREGVQKAAPAQDPAQGAAQPAPPVAWKEGDLRLDLEERPPYVVTNSFGYDKSQGYYVGTGLQQLNVGGMGRTVDYNIRAGNGTINNPTLAKWFPTGTYNRSVDSFSVGYTDPWFAPEWLQGILPERTQSRSEAAYIQERRDVYDLHRRRVTTSLQWSVNPRLTYTLGYRWERTDVKSAIPGIDSDDLAVIARYPVHAIVSAPFAQVARDTRDNSFDPTRGIYSMARVEFANQAFLSSPNASFVKAEVKNQWTWPVGKQARAGVVALGVHLGAVRPTNGYQTTLPLSERFFAGGPFSFRGVEPDDLGILVAVPDTTQPIGTNAAGMTQYALVRTPVGGQGLVLASLEYRFPLLGKSVWAELFVDSGQVYQSLKALPYEVRQAQAAPGDPVPAARPPLRTALGTGLIFKIGIPLKIEYAADVKRIWGLPRSQDDRNTQLKSLLISAGFQF